MQQPLSQANKEEGLRVLREEFGLLTQRLRPTAVVGTSSNKAYAENSLKRRHFVSVVSETRQGLEHFRLWV
jgi:hypothetical protein